MNILVTQSSFFRPGGHIIIKVSYMDDFYQETENVEDFNFESFFSSLGGFVGIFLGYSMMQIPEILCDIPSIVKKLKAAVKKGAIKIKSVNNFFQFK